MSHHVKRTSCLLLVLFLSRGQPAPGADSAPPDQPATPWKAMADLAEGHVAGGRTADARAALKAALPPDVNINTDAFHEPVDDADFKRLRALSIKLLSPGETAKLIRLQMNALHEALQAAPAGDEGDAIYRRWCDARYDYLRTSLLGRKRWQQAESFIQMGRTLNLKPYDLAREEFWQALLLFEEHRYLDSIRDRENQFWLRMASDNLGAGERQSKLRDLLFDPDPARRVEAAAEIKKAFGGTPVYHEEWDNDDKWLDTAFERIEACLQAASDEASRDQAADDAVEFAVRVERLYDWPPNPMAVPVLRALALSERVSRPEARLAFDAVRALALARRGEILEATSLSAQLAGRLAQAPGGAAERFTGRVERLNREVDKLAIKSLTPPAPRPEASAAAPAPEASDDQPRDLTGLVLKVCRHNILHDPDRDIVASSADTLVLTLFNSGRALEALRVVDDLIEKLGPDCPLSTKLSLQSARMKALAWQGRHRESVEIAVALADDHLRSPDPWTVYVVVDSLGHAYFYAAFEIGDMARAQSYLEKVREAYPDGRYEKCLEIFIQSYDRLSKLLPRVQN